MSESDPWALLEIEKTHLVDTERASWSNNDVLLPNKVFFFRPTCSYCPSPDNLQPKTTIFTGDLCREIAEQNSEHLHLPKLGARRGGRDWVVHK